MHTEKIFNLTENHDFPFNNIIKLMSVCVNLMTIIMWHSDILYYTNINNKKIANKIYIVNIINSYES